MRSEMGLYFEVSFLLLSLKTQIAGVALFF